MGPHNAGIKINSDDSKNNNNKKKEQSNNDCLTLIRKRKSTSDRPRRGITFKPCGKKEPPQETKKKKNHNLNSFEYARLYFVRDIVMEHFAIGQ